MLPQKLAMYLELYLLELHFFLLVRFYFILLVYANEDFFFSKIEEKYYLSIIRITHTQKKKKEKEKLICFVKLYDRFIF